MRSFFVIMAFALRSAFGDVAYAQADGLVAYVPEKPIARTADDPKITFVESAVAGKMEAIIPTNADRVDILNARGNIKASYGIREFDQIGLGDLRPGTWTLRVHRGHAMSIRRFVVMERGTVIWSPQGPIRKR